MMSQLSYHYGSHPHYRPPSASKNQPILVNGGQVLERNSWITFMEPIQADDYFILGSASRSQPGVHIYSNQRQESLQLSKFTGRVWAGAVDKGGRLLVAYDSGRVGLGSLKFSRQDVRVDSRADIVLDRASQQLELVKFVPEQPECIITSDRNALKLWNIVGGMATMSQQLFAADERNQPLRSFEWSPHMSNLVACATSKEGINVYDIRDRGRQLACSNFPCPNTGGGFNKLAWNPFIPYWMAACSDTEISIFDIRYCSPDPVLTIPTNLSSDICWSNSNSELLLSCSTSRNLRLWSLLEASGEHEEKGQLFSVPCAEYGGNIAKLCPSSHTPNRFYGLSLLGNLVSVEVKQEFLKRIAPISVPAQADQLLGDIERSLYCRDFQSLFEELLEYSDSATQTNFRNLHLLTNKTAPMLPISADSWSLASLSDDRQSFLADLKRHSLGIPPGFSLCTSDQPGGSLREAIEGVRFKVKIMEALQNGDNKVLERLSGKITETIRRNRSFFDAQTIFLIIKCYLENDRIAALAFGRDIIKAWGKSSVDSNICSLIHLLLYPTIFDEEASAVAPAATTTATASESPRKPASSAREDRGDAVAPPLPSPQPNRPTRASSFDSKAPTLAGKSLEVRKYLCSVEHALKMIDLEIAFEEAASPSDRQRIMLEAAHGDRFTLSACVVAATLEAYLERSQLDLYFTQLGKLCAGRHCTNFASALLDHMDRQVLPKLKYILAQAIDTHRPSLVVRAILLIAIIVDGLRPLPEDLEPLLADRLRRLSRALQGEDYSGMNGYAQLASFTHALQIPEAGGAIWDQLARLRGLLQAPGAK